MERALLLNATYEPLKVIDWQRAVTLSWQGKVEVLEVYDREIRSVTWNTRLPAVL
ncbi:MAG: HNH endonuclease, partial [Nitrospirae bacterium]|nr:HNH endonuclease [Nitrospirota bacterium]